MCRSIPPSATSLLIALTACALSLPMFQSAFAQPGQGPAPVVVSPVVEQQAMATQTFVGTVLPSQRATIGSAVDGRVVECDIEEGDRVEQNQPLAQLLTETISLELANAQSELDLKQARLAELENGTRAEVLEQARARMAAAKARQNYLVERRERLRELAEKTSAVTEDEWSEAVANALEAGETAAEAIAAYDEAKAGPRAETIAQAKAEVAMQQAVVDRLADQLKKHTIRSRFPGYVVAKNTEVGQWVNRGDVVAEVVGVDVVEVVVQVLEGSVPFVVPGAEVSVVVPALPQSPFEGKVVAVVPQGDVRARTFPVKVAIQNQSTPSGPLIKPGMYARVDLPVGNTKLIKLVPKDAVVLSQRAPTVYVVAEGTVQPVSVELGRSFGAGIEVEGELAAGQLVVVEGNERLRPGAPVNILRQKEPLTTAASSR